MLRHSPLLGCWARKGEASPHTQTQSGSLQVGPPSQEKQPSLLTLRRGGGRKRGVSNKLAAPTLSPWPPIHGAASHSAGTLGSEAMPDPRGLSQWLVLSTGFLPPGHGRPTSGEGLGRGRARASAHLEVAESCSQGWLGQVGGKLAERPHSAVHLPPALQSFLLEKNHWLLSQPPLPHCEGSPLLSGSAFKAAFSTWAWPEGLPAGPAGPGLPTNVSQGKAKTLPQKRATGCSGRISACQRPAEIQRAPLLPAT